ncbi:predicted protein [Naegleria gruberi]|uniref:Predicted protein n=1 Tax=Naegleria gruberi TaxID=5762 RepID=D2V0H3_NAEGR|nr:uncharacterized protein NAEGRDRAFT_62295 [Naegleria gruberi]EFC49523.1 predicted protein [Naegleria gruberi]|eukprot:XP_002682267.1 predicted protein [Naegleria gruberi strain NEG-M]
MKSCHDRMETQFRKSTFKECSYSDQCLLFGDNPSLVFKMYSERARRSGKDEYATLLGTFPSKCSQTIVESLIGREAIIFFFKQSNVSVELTKELVRGFFKENLQNQCGNYTENALEALRIFVQEMPKGMFNFLSFLEFQERVEKDTVSFRLLFDLSILISLIISTLVVISRKSNNTNPVSNSQPQSQKMFQLVKNIFLKLDNHNQNILQAESLIKARIEKSEKLKLAINDQENRISELTNNFNRMLNGSKAKDNTIAKTMELLNEIKDAIQSEKGREPLDVFNMPYYLKQLFKEKSESETACKEKNVKVLAEKKQLEALNKELKDRIEFIVSDNEDLGLKVGLLEESLGNQKSITHSLEDSVLSQSEQISKLLHSLKMKEDQEQKVGTELEISRNDVKLLEKHLNQTYSYFGILEEKNPESIRSFVESLRNESEIKTREIEKLQEQIANIEEISDEKIAKILEIESRVTSLQDENNSLRSQLHIATKKIESKYEKASDNHEILLKDLETVKRDLEKTKLELA